MTHFKRALYEYDELKTTGGVKVSYGATFDEAEAKKRFKKVVQSGGDIALKYSAFYVDPKVAGGHVFMLGWDHAMIVEKRLDGHYAVAILASGQSDANADVCVYDARGARGEKLEASAIDEMPPAGLTGKPTRWRRYDLRDMNLKVSRLVTFSITSCSFACLWPEDASMLFVSHMAFAAPIPLFWLLRKNVAKTPHQRVRMLGSLNQTADELGKFSVENLRDADHYQVDANFLLRGPYKCRDLGTFAPFKTHPYVTLSFDRGEITYGGVLGFNNDPDMPVEMPPFHSTIGNALHSFTNCADPAKILAEEAKLLEGTYGFTSLHRLMLDLIARADAVEKDNDKKKRFYQSNEQYQSEVVTRLEKLTVSKKVVIPEVLRGKVRAVFLLAELTTNPKNKKFKLAFDAVMAAWRAEQMAFSMPLCVFHHPGVPELVPQLVEERPVYPGMTAMNRMVHTMKTNPVFIERERAFNEQQARDNDGWDD